METSKDFIRWTALCAVAGISIALASAASPAWAADLPSEGASIKHQTPASGLLMAGAVDTMDKNPGTAPAAGSGTPDSMIPTQAKPENNELYKKMPEEVIGLKVVDVDGQLVGKVDDLVINKDDASNVGAVVAMDQILGLIGGRKVVVPLDVLQLQNGELHIAISKNELKTSPDYNEDFYMPIPEKDQKPISDFLV